MSVPDFALGVGGGSAVKEDKEGLGLEGLVPPVASLSVGIRATGEPVPGLRPGLETIRDSWRELCRKQCLQS